MGNLFSTTPPSRPVAVGLAPARLGLVEVCYAPGPGTSRGQRFLVRRAAPPAAYLQLAAAPGPVPLPATAVVPMPAALGASASPFLAMLLRLPVGPSSAPGIFLAIPPASSGSPFLAFGVVAGGPGSASPSAGALITIPAGLSAGSGLPAAARIVSGASLLARLGPDSAALPGSRLSAAAVIPYQADSDARAAGGPAESFFGSAVPVGTRGSGGTGSAMPEATLSHSRLRGVAEAPGDTEAMEPPIKAKGSSDASKQLSLPLVRPIPVDNLIELESDSLSQVLMLLNRRELFYTMFTCKSLYHLISSQKFYQMYQDGRDKSLASLLCLYDNESLNVVADTLDDPLPISVEFLADKHMWRLIDSRDGFLLMEPKFGGNCFLVCNPLTRIRIDIPGPPNVPPLYTMMAAGLAPEGTASWRIITLFGCTVKSVSRTRERCWVGLYSSVTKSWDGKHQQVDFELPASRGVKLGSVLTAEHWNVLIFNKSILSVDLKTLLLMTRKLPFSPSILHIPPHVLGKNREEHLCLIMHDERDLVVFSYEKSNEPKEFRRYSGFAYHANSSFAEKNCFLLLDGLLCFDIQTGSVILPFTVDSEIRVGNLVPYEMAWPPKPRLHGGTDCADLFPATKSAYVDNIHEELS